VSHRFRFGMSRWLTVALLLLAFVGSAMPASGANPDPFGRQPDDPILVARQQRLALQARIASQQNRLVSLNAAGDRLTAALTKTASSLSSIMVDLGQLQTDIDLAQADLDAAVAERDGLQQQVESLDWSLEALSQQADELAADLDARRAALGARLADAYRASQTGLWEQVLTANSFLDAIVQQQGALALGEHDQELAASIQADQALLDEQRLELRHLRYTTDQLRADVATRAIQITGDRDQLLAANARLADLQAQTLALQAAQQAKYQQVLDNQAKVSAIIAQQTAEQDKLTGQIKRLVDKERHSGRLPSAYNGTLRWPLIGAISQDFGCTHFVLEPPRGNCDHFHTGIDIVGPIGSPIVAPGDGIILWVGYETGVPVADANYYVMIAHSDHLVTILGHLQPKSPARIRIGAKVLAGQVIGWEGDTGNSTGAHCHWGVFLDGEPQNPRFFL
jgi:murein DD-endopeptidase MepM/ murein hydrolase activator NlpD